MPTPFAQAMAFHGLDRAKRVLRMAAGSGMHAALLYGDRGTGKTTLATALAQAWMCLSPTPDGPCQECRVCAAMERGRAVDFQRITPYGDGGFIRLGAICGDREDKKFEGVPVQEFFRTRPLMAKSKVVLLDGAERLTHDAANALLKILEEPSVQSRLVLTASDLGAVLPTIRSRALTIACDSPAPADDHWARPLASAQGDFVWAESNQDILQPLLAKLQCLEPGRLDLALSLSEACRKVGESLSASGDDGARNSQATVMRAVAHWLLHERPEHPHWAQAAARSYRLILGNVAAGLAWDALFGTILE